MTVSFIVRNEDASKNLPLDEGATARMAWSEETTPIRSSRTMNDLQHATRWRSSVVGHCKHGLSQSLPEIKDMSWNSIYAYDTIN